MSEQTGKLTGKVALVTGASKGIGASIATHLAAAGAAVVVNYSSSKSGADQVVKTIVAGGGKAVAVQGNMAEPKDITRVFAETSKAFGRLDVLVNNAGIYDFKPLGQVTPEQFHSMFNLNVLGLVLATQEALKYFGGAGGNVINISSSVTGQAIPGTTVYSGTKAAVDVITKIHAKELGSKKIRVNAINPGLVQTEGVTSAGFDHGDFRKDYESRSALGRIGQPKDIATAAVFLASNDADWITGQTIFVDGGF